MSIEQPIKREDGVDYYEVEKILDKRVVKNKEYYLIKWVGWGIKNSSWEPIDNLKYIQYMVDEYNEEQVIITENNKLSLQEKQQRRRELQNEITQVEVAVNKARSEFQNQIQNIFVNNKVFEQLGIQECQKRIQNIDEQLFDQNQGDFQKYEDKMKEIIRFFKQLDPQKVPLVCQHLLKKRLSLKTIQIFQQVNILKAEQKIKLRQKKQQQSDYSQNPKKIIQLESTTPSNSFNLFSDFILNKQDEETVEKQVSPLQQLISEQKIVDKQMKKHKTNTSIITDLQSKFDCESSQQQNSQQVQANEVIEISSNGNSQNFEQLAQTLENNDPASQNKPNKSPQQQKLKKPIETTPCKKKQKPSSVPLEQTEKTQKHLENNDQITTNQKKSKPINIFKQYIRTNILCQRAQKFKESQEKKKRDEILQSSYGQEIQSDHTSKQNYLNGDNENGRDIETHNVYSKEDLATTKSQSTPPQLDESQQSIPQAIKIRKKKQFRKPTPNKSMDINNKSIDRNQKKENPNQKVQNTVNNEDYKPLTPLKTIQSEQPLINSSYKKIQARQRFKEQLLLYKQQLQQVEQIVIEDQEKEENCKKRPKRYTQTQMNELRRTKDNLKEQIIQNIEKKTTNVEVKLNYLHFDEDTPSQQKDLLRISLSNLFIDI